MQCCHRFTLIDVKLCHKAIPHPASNAARTRWLPLLLASVPSALPPGARCHPRPPVPRPPAEAFIPLSQVHRGQMATAWTVFTGTKPEPMQVEILGVLRGARGPGQDMILAQLHGAKPEYTGVVAGMSGSPVYIGNKLLGSLSYRIGQFSQGSHRRHHAHRADAGSAAICPISTQWASASPASPLARQRKMDFHADGMNFQAMETPLVMSGFRPEAIRLWQKKMAGTGLEIVAAGGGSGSSKPDADGSFGAISACGHCERCTGFGGQRPTGSRRP